MPHVSPSNRISTILTASLVVSLQPLLAGDAVKPAVTKEPDAAQVKAEQELVSKNLKALGQLLEKSTKCKVVALVDVRAEKESDENTASAKLLQSDLLQALLGQGILVFPLEEDHKLEPKRANGSLPSGLLYTQEDAAYLKKEKKADLILTPRLDVAKTACSLNIEIRDLTSAAVVTATALPVSFSKVPLAKSCAVEVLPELNVKVLAFAAGHIGRQVDRGECWDLPATPLRAREIMVQGYNFGKKVKWEEALPGDVLTSTHHVMVLVKPTADKRSAVILHQNFNNLRSVVLDHRPANLAGEITVWRPGASE